MKKDYPHLVYDSKWADFEVYMPYGDDPETAQKRYEYWENLLMEEHNEGKHEKYHIIQCDLCQEQYN